MSAVLTIQDHIIEETKKEAKGFTGIWVTKEIHQLGLSRTQSEILAYIAGFERSHKVFFGSNKHLAELFNLSESSVSRYITQLKRMNLIEEVGYNGRHRRLGCLMKNWTRENVAKSLSIKDSKKVLCAEMSSQTTQKLPVRLRKNDDSIYIVKSDRKKDSKTTTPLPPKKEAMNPIDERPSVVVVLKKSEEKPKKPEITKDDVHFYCVKARKDWTPDEIDSAWEAYKDSNSSISDTYAYISGIIDKKRILAQNQRNKARHTREKPCSKTSTQISKKESQNTKTTSTAGGFSEQQLAELLGPNRAFKRSSSS